MYGGLRKGEQRKARGLYTLGLRTDHLVTPQKSGALWSAVERLKLDIFPPFQSVFLYDIDHPAIVRALPPYFCVSLRREVGVSFFMYIIVVSSESFVSCPRKLKKKTPYYCSRVTCQRAGSCHAEKVQVAAHNPSLSIQCDSL